MHELYDGSGFRLNEDPGIELLSVGECLIFVYGWAHCGPTVFFLSLHEHRFVCEWRVLLFVSSQYVYFDCFPMMMHRISKE